MQTVVTVMSGNKKTLATVELNYTVPPRKRLIFEAAFRNGFPGARRFSWVQGEGLFVAKQGWGRLGRIHDPRRCPRPQRLLPRERPPVLKA